MRCVAAEGELLSEFQSRQARALHSFSGSSNSCVQLGLAISNDWSSSGTGCNAESVKACRGVAAGRHFPPVAALSPRPAVNIGLMMAAGFFVNGPYALITTAVSADLGTHQSLAGASGHCAACCVKQAEHPAYGRQGNRPLPYCCGQHGPAHIMSPACLAARRPHPMFSLSCRQREGAGHGDCYHRRHGLHWRGHRPAHDRLHLRCVVVHAWLFPCIGLLVGAAKPDDRPHLRPALFWCVAAACHCGQLAACAVSCIVTLACSPTRRCCYPLVPQSCRAALTMCSSCSTAPRPRQVRSHYCGVPALLRRGCACSRQHSAAQLSCEALLCTPCTPADSHSKAVRNRTLTRLP